MFIYDNVLMMIYAAIKNLTDSQINQLEKVIVRILKDILDGKMDFMFKGKGKEQY